jgi:hypothetical protein
VKSQKLGTEARAFCSFAAEIVEDLEAALQQLAKFSLIGSEVAVSA